MVWKGLPDKEIFEQRPECTGETSHRKVKKTEIQAQEILNTPWAGTNQTCLTSKETNDAGAGRWLKDRIHRGG